MKKLAAIGISLAGYLSLALPAFAEQIKPIDPCPVEQKGFTNFNPLCHLNLDGGIIGALITTAFIIATLIALAFLIYGGIRWITSGGDKTGVETARNTIVASIVGLVIVFLSYFIIRLLFGFFNLDLKNLQLPNITSEKKAECVDHNRECGGNLGTNCCESGDECREITQGIKRCLIKN